MTVLLPSGGLAGRFMYQLCRRTAPVVPLPLVRTLAGPPADAARLLWASGRRHAEVNFAHVLGTTPDDHRAISLARQAFRHFGLYVAELMHLQGWDTDDLLDRIDVEGVENFAAAEAHGRGVIFVSGHMGSTEVAAALAVLRGYQITAVTERIPVEWMMDWIVRTRRKMGITLISADGAGIGLIRRLRKGGMIAMVVDAGVDSVGSVPVDFFGRQTRFPEGPARLSRLTGAPLVFGLAVRLPGGRFRAHVCPPILPSRDSPAETETQRLTQQLASTFEHFVRRHPAQWYPYRPIWPPTPIS
ncbi:MAG TPA: lysophospholipid acyltransferase family protein [Dehalococcoidia bacterium]|nr:lysophospholipid acyltransferase family protein [Dehalococcoidia bacterium]